MYLNPILTRERCIYAAGRPLLNRRCTRLKVYPPPKWPIGPILWRVGR